MSTSIRAEGSLNGAIARTIRASEHLSELVRGIETLRQEQLNAIAWEFDPQLPDEFRPVVRQYLPVPVLFSILISEICFNLRSALNYLVYEMAILNSGQIVEGTQFPIEDKPKGFRWREKRGWLAGLNAAHIAAIEVLQPYRGCNWTRALRDISNPDKHIRLVSNEGWFELQVFPAADRLKFLNIPGVESSALHPVTGRKVYMKINLVLRVQFTDGTPVVETLQEIKSQVTRMLEVFQPEFQ